ncbi:MAG TPA: HPr family phosphocarrier protein [Aestuariivirgaceae bacterium]
MSKADTPLASRVIEIVNTRGLHARASAKFVKCAEGFEADITVTRDGQTVPATSIMGLMMLAAQRGSTILIEATGPDADRAVEALSRLILDRFGED